MLPCISLDSLQFSKFSFFFFNRINLSVNFLQNSSVHILGLALFFKLELEVRYRWKDLSMTMQIVKKLEKHD